MDAGGDAQDVPTKYNTATEQGSQADDEDRASDKDGDKRAAAELEDEIVDATVLQFPGST